MNGVAANTTCAWLNNSIISSLTGQTTTTPPATVNCSGALAHEKNQAGICQPKKVCI
jgi:hypothetical protein